jgi:hypothetical protein
MWRSGGERITVSGSTQTSARMHEAILRVAHRLDMTTEGINPASGMRQLMRTIPTRAKNEEILRRISREVTFNPVQPSRQTPMPSVFVRQRNRYESTEETAHGHVCSPGRPGRCYGTERAHERASIRASSRHCPIRSSTDAHRSRSRTASRLRVGRRPLALGWSRLCVGAGPLAAGTGRCTLAAGSLGAAGTELAMD